MIVAIDIGNTNTGIAVLRRGRARLPAGKAGPARIESVATGIRGCYEKRLSKALRELTKDRRPKTKGRVPSPESPFPQQVLICSVVPKATTIAQRCVKKVFKINAKIVGKDIKAPMVNKYGNPKQVGQDRLVCAYAAAELYGVPCVVVDLGTAITLDAISAKKEYLGGMIVPGIRLSAEALFEKTALLPKVTVKKPGAVIGKTTEQSILSGLFYGYGEMITGLVDLLAKQLGSKPKIVITGGYSDIMRHFIPKYTCVIDKELIFKGMGLLNGDGLIKGNTGKRG